MRFTTSAFITSFVVGQAAATGWLDAPKLNCPSTADNTCNTQQKAGFDWGSLAVGGFSSYGQFDFKGFSCQNKFGKRSLIRRDFQSKCITGKVSKASGPSFSCQQQQGFSVDHYHVSVDVDTDLEFHHQMPDGSVCKQKASCKTGGTVVQNTQCGGAKAVTVALPEGSKSNGCNVGIHSIGFNCNGPPPVSKSTPTPSPPAPPPVRISSPTSAPVVYTTKTSSISSVVLISSVSSSVYSSPTSSVYSAPSTSILVSSSISTIILVSSASSPSFSIAVPTTSSTAVSPVLPTTTSSSVVSPVLPTTSSSVVSPILYSTTSTSSAIVYTSTSVSSVVLISSSASSYSVVYSSTPVSPVLPTTSSTVSSVVLYSSSTTISTLVRSPSPAPPGPAPAPAPCPDVLPKCLNTWLHATQCKDNTDHDCFCKDASFSGNVISCVQSWGMDTTEMQKALSYFVGICADHVKDNPGLITKCPKDLPLTPPPQPIKASSTVETTSTTVLVVETTTTCPPGKTYTDDAGKPTVYKSVFTSTIRRTTTSTVCTRCMVGPTPEPVIPVTTVVVQNVYTVPCTYSTGVSMGYEIPDSSTTTSLSTQVTVPQVDFNTFANNAATTPSVDLYPVTTAVGAVVGAGGTAAAAVSSYSYATATSTGVAQFTGAANHKAASLGSLAMGAAVAAYFAL